MVTKAELDTYSARAMIAFVEQFSLPAAGVTASWQPEAGLSMLLTVSDGGEKSPRSPLPAGTDGHLCFHASISWALTACQFIGFVMYNVGRAGFQVAHAGDADRPMRCLCIFRAAAVCKHERLIRARKAVHAAGRQDVSLPLPMFEGSILTYCRQLPSSDCTIAILSSQPWHQHLLA